MLAHFLLCAPVRHLVQSLGVGHGPTTNPKRVEGEGEFGWICRPTFGYRRPRRRDCGRVPPAPSYDGGYVLIADCNIKPFFTVQLAQHLVTERAEVDRADLRRILTESLSEETVRVEEACWHRECMAYAVADHARNANPTPVLPTALWTPLYSKPDFLPHPVIPYHRRAALRGDRYERYFPS